MISSQIAVIVFFDINCLVYLKNGKHNKSLYSCLLTRKKTGLEMEEFECKAGRHLLCNGLLRISKSLYEF